MKQISPETRRLANLFIEAGTLKKIARSHRQQFYADDLSDNIASHSFRVSVIACCLALKLNANLEKVLVMSIFHDFSEIRSGDQNWVHKRYVRVDEKQIRTDQLQGLFPGDPLFNLTEEYEARTSFESKIVKDADRLEQLLLEKEYATKGNLVAASWSTSKHKLERFLLEESRELAKAIQELPSSDWWNSLWTETRIV